MIPPPGGSMPQTPTIRQSMDDARGKKKKAVRFDGPTADRRQAADGFFGPPAAAPDMALRGPAPRRQRRPRIQTSQLSLPRFRTSPELATGTPSNAKKAARRFRPAPAAVRLFIRGDDKVFLVGTGNPKAKVEELTPNRAWPARQDANSFQN